MLLSLRQSIFIMNEALKVTALDALKTLPNVSQTDVANILECIQQCYAETEGKTSEEERFLVSELQFFINELKA